MNIGVFLTRGYGLNSWKINGTLNRELDFYSSLLDQKAKIFFFSYEKKNIEPTEYLKKNTFVLTRPSFIPKYLYSFLIPFIHRKSLAQLDVIKTNQIQGSLEAFFCSLIFKKSFYSRSGYINSSNPSFKNLFFLTKFLITLEEYISCKYSKNISVSSQFAINHLSKKYNVPISKFTLMYNFVDNVFFESFKKRNYILKDVLKVCFVGRLVELKQPLLLFDILENIKNIELYILGKGPLIDEMKKKFSKSSIKLKFVKKLSNYEIADFFIDKHILLLPTLEEGNSKVIIEAMSSGLTVLSNNINANKELITNSFNGFLIDNNEIALYKYYLKEIINKKIDLKKIGDNANLFAKNNFKKEIITKIEESQLNLC